ncbi:MAG: DNA (cytosine-5-)-methyltransferase [Lachnospiraceae bacterium]|nr:DNA (cytosine-5-)-methyltransferase [Lachnospiraceae bacterium]
MGRRYKVIDLFSGIGGFSLGFLKSGFDVVFAVEKNKRACYLYSENIQNVEVMCEDIQQIDISELPDFDVLIGTMPIQNFKRPGKDKDMRNTLLAKEEEIIKNRMPKAFVLEAGGHWMSNEAIRELTREYIDFGYYIQWKYLETEKIAGMPIKEKRLYIVGLVDGESFFEFDEETRVTRFREIMQNADEIADRNEKIAINSRLGDANKRIIDPDKDSFGFNYFNIPYVQDEIGIRPITCRECARLKGFPDNYEVMYDGTREAYRLLSLATNVKVAEKLAGQLKRILDKEKKEVSKDLTNSKVDRQNILNNEMALKEIQRSSNIKGIPFENKLYFTKNMTADFFDVDIRTIERYVAANTEELTRNGYEILKGKRLKEFIKIVEDFAAPDINVGSISRKTTQMAIFDFKAFLNVAMLLAESENAKLLRQIMLNIVIDLINKKSGGSTKYINQRDKDFLGAYLQEEDYRKEFTDVLRDCVDMEEMKYALFTNMIYQSIFKENAKEYRTILKLKERDRTRDTFYSEILDLVASYECGLAAMIKQKSEERGKKLSNWETKQIFKDFENLPHWQPLILRARSKMASRDWALRDAFHYQLQNYIKPLEQEEYEKFLGTEADEIAKLMEENQDVLKRLKERG